MATGKRKRRRQTASAPAIGRGDALRRRVASLFALVAVGHRGHSIAADRIADVERAEAAVAAVVPEHPFVIDDGSETRTAGAWLEHLDRQGLIEECPGPTGTRVNNPDYHQRQIVWSGPETGGCQLRLHPEPTGQRRAIITEAERTARNVGRAGRLLKIAVTHLQELELPNPLHYL